MTVYIAVSSGDAEVGNVKNGGKVSTGILAFQEHSRSVHENFIVPLLHGENQTNRGVAKVFRNLYPQLIQLFLALSVTIPEELGYDQTTELVLRDQKTRFRIAVGTERYLTEDIICNQSTSRAVIGQSTRV
ncbi:hypothetical protein FRB95_014231 [Tulasnella sp. JGI-2019a]|nr:hypothetical protein FRB93_012134 [Tulasnella sp. JGI-2019a]KAG9033810.1 hypothetical protein FRB95_014231 [Tulasnella sp. JGI-2019a]